MKRWLQHVFARPAARAYPEASLQRIGDAIRDAEQKHRGQIAFAVETAMPWRALWRGDTARTRAVAAFSRLRVWDTADNNGVLIYLLLAERRIEVVADRAVPIDTATWEQVCARMAEALRAGAYEQAALDAIAATSALLAASHPHADGVARGNELPDRPTLLD